MYYIYGISGPSLLIESTDSMIKQKHFNYPLVFNIQQNRTARMHLSATTLYQATFHSMSSTHTPSLLKIWPVVPSSRLPDFMDNNKLEYDYKIIQQFYSILLCVVYMQQFIYSSIFCVFNISLNSVVSNASIINYYTEQQNQFRIVSALASTVSNRYRTRFEPVNRY